MKLYYLATNNLHPPLQPALGGDLQKRLVTMVTMVTMDLIETRVSVVTIVTIVTTLVVTEVTRSH